jgi:hypothetical protein
MNTKHFGCDLLTSLFVATVTQADVNDDVSEDSQHHGQRPITIRPKISMKKASMSCRCAQNWLIVNWIALEAKVWLANCFEHDAGNRVAGLVPGKVKEARRHLKYGKINPDALHGSIYTSLGSLYYQVPDG